MPLRNRCATLFAFALSLAAAGAGAQEPSFQGNDLFGRPMYTHGSNPVNVGGTDQLQRAREEARRAWEADPSIDNATWYGRVLAYQGLHREAIEVFTAGLKRHPQSGKLLRHRAHRYVNLREFDKSIADGLRAAELYRGKPLERERLGPDYFPSTPDVVQFYLYYHLGHAYFAKKDFPAAAQWFSRSREVALGVEDLPIHAAAVYWQYLSLARDLRFDEARALVADYPVTMYDLRDNPESNYYFDGVQFFRGLRDPATYLSNQDTGKPFSTADGVTAGTAYTVANHWLIRGDLERARPLLRLAMSIDTWSFFARVQAEADWVALFGDEHP